MYNVGCYLLAFRRGAAILESSPQHKKSYRGHFRCLQPEDYPAKWRAWPLLESVKPLLNDRIVGSDIPGSEESDQDVTILKPLLFWRVVPNIFKKRGSRKEKPEMASKTIDDENNCVPAQMANVLSKEQNSPSQSTV